MAEINTLWSETTVSLELNPSLEHLADVAETSSFFVADAPKHEPVVQDSTCAATETYFHDCRPARETALKPQSALTLHTHYISGRFGYDIHWLRETVAGRLDGLQGLRIPADQPFEAWIETGRPDEPETGVWVVIAPRRDLVPSRLLLAMLGIHPLDWAWSLFSDVGSVAWKGLAHDAGVPTEELEEFHRLWRSLGASGRAELWTAAGTSEGLAELEAVLTEKVSDPRTPLTSGIRDGLRILTKPELNKLFRFVHVEAEKQFAPERIAAAFERYDDFALLLPWTRRRISALLGVTGADTFPALQSKLPDLRDAEERIRASVRSVLASELARERCRMGCDDSVETSLDRYIPVHFPFFDRKELVKQGIDWSDTTRMSAGAPSVFILRADESPAMAIMESEVLQVLALPFRQAEAVPTAADASLVFTYHRTPRGQWSDPFWREILSSYGFPQDASQGESTLTVCSPLELLQAWSRVPGTRDASFFPVFSKMAQAIQRTLRRWSAALVFSTPDPVVDLHSALPLLVYQAIEPFPGRGRCHFTYDPMDAGDLQKALRSASRRFCATMGQIQKEFEERGQKIDAQDFLLKDPNQLLKWVSRHPRQLASLLTLESFVIEEFVRLADMLRELRQLLIQPSGNAVRQMAGMVDDFVTALHRKLRKVQGEDFSVLAPLLLLEATNALSSGPPPEATLTIQTSGRMRVYSAPTVVLDEA